MSSDEDNKPPKGFLGWLTLILVIPIGLLFLLVQAIIHGVGWAAIIIAIVLLLVIVFYRMTYLREKKDMKL